MFYSNLIFLFFSLSLFLNPSVYAKASQAPVLTLAGKSFTEQDLLVDLLATVLKEAQPDLVIHKKKNLGGTGVTFEAVKNGAIDMYVEYSGTAYYSIFKEKQKRSKEQIHEFLTHKMDEQGLFWSPSLGFNNTYAVLVKDNEETSQVKTISDLKNLSPTLSIGIDPEIATRPDGFDSFLKIYDLNFKNTHMVNAGLLYQTIENKQTDVILGYATDGRILLADLKILEDDLSFFQDYSASVLINKKTLLKYPWISLALEKTYGKINNEAMQSLNYQVDAKKLDSVDVAESFAQEKGWAAASMFTDPLDHSFWNFLKARKKFLLKKIYEHLFITFLAFFLVTVIGISLGILCYYNHKIQKVVFLVVNLCQTIPSLALFGILIPILGIGLKPSLVALVLYSLLPIVRNTYTGLYEVPPSILETCEIIGMNRRQILFKALLPMSLMTISAGLRTSLVIIVGTATIASFIGAGGLGDPIFQGITSLNNRLILLGAIPSALLAILLDLLLHYGTYFLLSPGLKQQRQNHS